MLGFMLLCGYMIARLSLNPLQEYVKNLQDLSKETLHELNLPISTITTNLNMIKKSVSDAKNLRRLDRIQTACYMLQERYNELDYMIKAQTQKKISESFYLDELIKERVTFLKQIYSHIDFNLDLQRCQILNDKIGLGKVIDNILDNAVKYSQNSTKIDIKLTDKTLYIQDYGCGMDEIELIHIFDNYYQSDNNMKGFGIGLSMVKRFCDTQNILLSFKSKPNMGTTVLLKFKEN